MKNNHTSALTVITFLLLSFSASPALALDSTCVCNAPVHTSRGCGIMKPYYKVIKADCDAASGKCGGTCTYELFRDKELTASCGTVTDPCGAPKPEPIKDDSVNTDDKNTGPNTKAF
jgi:hypothetical protein